MVSDNPMFLYAGEYEDVDDAKADLEELKELHRGHVVGTYDATDAGRRSCPHGLTISPLRAW
jgi:hypothetical protein